MENASTKIQTITIDDPHSDKTYKLEGKIGIFASDRGISIVALEELKSYTENDSKVTGYEIKHNQYINLVFYPGTSQAFIKNIARDIRNVLAHDGNVHICIAKIKNATDDFMDYIKSEIGSGNLSDDLYVLDLGTGIYITNRIKVHECCYAGYIKDKSAS